MYISLQVFSALLSYEFSSLSGRVAMISYDILSPFFEEKKTRKKKKTRNVGVALLQTPTQPCDRQRTRLSLESLITPDMGAVTSVLKNVGYSTQKQVVIKSWSLSTFIPTHDVRAPPHLALQ